MTKATLKNAHNGPVDVESLDGLMRVPAMGQLTANFADDYLVSLDTAGIMSVERLADEKPKEKSDAKRK